MRGEPLRNGVVSRPPINGTNGLAYWAHVDDGRLARELHALSTPNWALVDDARLARELQFRSPPEEHPRDWDPFQELRDDDVRYWRDEDIEKHLEESALIEFVEFLDEYLPQLEELERRAKAAMVPLASTEELEIDLGLRSSRSSSQQRQHDRGLRPRSQSCERTDLSWRDTGSSLHPHDTGRQPQQQQQHPRRSEERGRSGTIKKSLDGTGTSGKQPSRRKASEERSRCMANTNDKSVAACASAAEAKPPGAAGRPSEERSRSQVRITHDAGGVLPAARQQLESSRTKAVAEGRRMAPADGDDVVDDVVDGTEESGSASSAFTVGSSSAPVLSVHSSPTREVHARTVAPSAKRSAKGRKKSTETKVLHRGQKKDTGKKAKAGATKK